MRTALALVLIDNSITLTPGTLMMDSDPDRSALYVHALSGDPTHMAWPVRQWENYALVVFDEPVSSNDSLPDPERVTDGTVRPETGKGPDPGTDRESGGGDDGSGESPAPDGGENGGG